MSSEGDRASRWARSVFSSASAVDADPARVDHMVQVGDRQGCVGGAEGGSRCRPADQHLPCRVECSILPCMAGLRVWRAARELGGHGPAARGAPVSQPRRVAVPPAACAAWPQQTVPAARAAPPTQGLLQLFASHGLPIPLHKCGQCVYRLGPAGAKLPLRLVNGRLVARAGAGQTMDILAWLEKQPAATGPQQQQACRVLR